MKRVWKTVEFQKSALYPNQRSWWCQLIHLDVDELGFTVDLFSLEPSPEPAVGIPAGVPFSLRINRDDALRSESISDDVRRWAAEADVVCIRIGQMNTSAWMCISTGQNDLVIEIAHPG